MEKRSQPRPARTGTPPSAHSTSSAASIPGCPSSKGQRGRRPPCVPRNVRKRRRSPFAGEIRRQARHQRPLGGRQQMRCSAARRWGIRQGMKSHGDGGGVETGGQDLVRCRKHGLSSQPGRAAPHTTHTSVRRRLRLPPRGPETGSAPETCFPAHAAG